MQQKEPTWQQPKTRSISRPTKGRVVIEMRPDLAPSHVARIKELVREGFYDGIVFHRVIDGFMAQTGCPHGTGTGGSGKKLKAEFNAEPHVRGIVSMARAQSPDSADSQFFICFDDATFLDGQYTVWGKVTRAWRTSTRSSAASRWRSRQDRQGAYGRRRRLTTGSTSFPPRLRGGQGGALSSADRAAGVCRAAAAPSRPSPASGRGDAGTAGGDQPMRFRFGRATALLPLPLAGEGGEGEAAR